MTKPIVQLENVSFAYNGEHALENVSLDIQQGEYLGVIGPNGGGKTTLLKTMLGLIEPQTGSVKLFGEPIADFEGWYRVGYVPQRATNFDTKLPVTVEEVVGFGRVSRVGMWRQFGQSDRRAIQDAMEKVDILPLRHRPIMELSGGQQQRVFIAKALVSKPEILILDEPTVGIDVHSQDAFYELLKQLNRDERLTLVMVSHDVDVVVNEVTRIACINETLVYHGTPKQFLKDDYLEQLYGKERKYILHGH